MSGLSKVQKNNSKIIVKHKDDAAFSEHAREKFGKTAAAQAEILNVSSEEDNVSDADLQSLNPNTQAYISEQKNSKVNQAGAEEISLATSADDAKNSQFVDSVNTDEDVWAGKISFEKYDDDTYKVVKETEDGKKVVMGYTTEKEKDNYYHGAAKEMGGDQSSSGNSTLKSPKSNSSNNELDDDLAKKNSGLGVGANGVGGTSANSSNNDKNSGSSSKNGKVSSLVNGIGDSDLLDKKQLAQYDKNISKLEANFGNLSSKEIEQLENDYDSTINSLEKAKNKLEDSLSEPLSTSMYTKEISIEIKKRNDAKKDISTLKAAIHSLKKMKKTVKISNDQAKSEVTNYKSKNGVTEKQIKAIPTKQEGAGMGNTVTTIDYKDYSDRYGEVSKVQFVKMAYKVYGKNLKINGIDKDIYDVIEADKAITAENKKYIKSDKYKKQASKALETLEKQKESYLELKDNLKDKSFRKKYIDELKKAGYTVDVKDIEKEIDSFLDNYDSQVESIKNPDYESNINANTYDYYYDTIGEKAANKFLSDMQDSFHQTIGMYQAYNSTKNVGNTKNTLKSASDYGYVAFNNFSEGAAEVVEGLGRAIQGVKAIGDERSTNDDTYSIDEYRRMYSTEYLAKKQGNYATVANVSKSVGGVAPAVLISCIPIVGQGASAVTIGVSQFGNKYHQTLVEGYSSKEAISYGVISGVSEATLSYFIGGIPGVSKASEFSKAAAASGSKAMKAADIVLNMAKEGTEEGLQTALDLGFVRASVLGESTDQKTLLKSSGEAALYGALTAGVLQSGRHFKGSVSNFYKHDGSDGLTISVYGDHDKIYKHDMKDSKNIFNYSDNNELNKHNDNSGKSITISGIGKNGELSGIVKTAKGKLNSIKGADVLGKFKSLFKSSSAIGDEINENVSDKINNSDVVQLEDIGEPVESINKENIDEKRINLSEGNDEYILKRQAYKEAEENYNNYIKKLELDNKFDSNVIKDEQFIKLDNELAKAREDLYKVVNSSKVEVSSKQGKLGTIVGADILGKFKSLFKSSSAIGDEINENVSDKINNSDVVQLEDIDEPVESINKENINENSLKAEVSSKRSKLGIIMGVDVAEKIKSVFKSNSILSGEMNENVSDKTKVSNIRKGHKKASSLSSQQKFEYEEIKNMNSNEIRKTILKGIPNILEDPNVVKSLANLYNKKDYIDYEGLVYTENKKSPTIRAINEYDNYFSSLNISKIDQGYLRHYRTFDFFGDDDVNINNRFYLNLEGNDILKFNKLFVEECLNEKLPFYFKTGIYSKEYKEYSDTNKKFTLNKKFFSPKLLKRSDSIVIYCTEDNCGDMFRIIKKIQNENPDISFLEPPIATGKVDIGIGYGSERKNTSYNLFKSDEFNILFRDVNKAFKEKYGNSNFETINKHFDEYFRMVNEEANKRKGYNSALSWADEDFLSGTANSKKSDWEKKRDLEIAAEIHRKLVLNIESNRK